MCTATQTTTLPSLQQLAEQWASVVCSYYPDVDPVRVAPPIGEGVRCFYRFVNDQPVSWDLGRLLSLLVDQPAIHDVTLVFNSLRKAMRHLMADRDLQTVLWISDRLDEWLAQMITRYDTHRVHQSRKRWQDAVQRLSRLNTLSHCVAALNTSLDLQSAFTATVELGRLLTSADVCVFYQCEGSVLRLRAYAGEVAPAQVIPIEMPDLQTQTIIDRSHQDFPLEVASKNLALPEVRALHCLPLQTNNVVTGKLLFIFFDEQTLSLQDLRLQEIFAGHASQAIYNAQLYERLSVLSAAHERRQIACEMHDTLLQTLISLNINLRVMHSFAQEGRWDDLLPLVDSVRDLGKLAMQEGRDTLNDLRCDADDRHERNLIDALQPEIDAFADRAGFQPQFAFDEDAYIPSDVSHHMCRLVGEALTNVHRHARASAVQITIECSDDTLHIRIVDDGVGFHPGHVDQRMSFGLLGMQERARLIDAQIAIDSAPSKGTVVRINWPLRSMPKGN